jgi:putative oxidoreductase
MEVSTMKKDFGLRDVGLLVLRVTAGTLMAGHGAQKLFGWFGGHGMEGTSGFMESMGLKPGKPWAAMAGLSEFGGGLLTALGLLNPLGTLGTIGAMSMATAKAHWGKPIWNTSGGAELPVVYSAGALALGLLRPGKFSLDNVFGINLPRRIILIPGLILTAATVAVGMRLSNQPQPQIQTQPQAAKQETEPVSMEAQPSATANDQVDGATEPARDYTEPRANEQATQQ